MRTTKFYRIPDLCRIVGLTRSGIYKLIREDKFPRGVKLTKRATGWPDDIVEQWIRDRLEQQLNHSGYDNTSDTTRPPNRLHYAPKGGQV